MFRAVIFTLFLCAYSAPLTEDHGNQQASRKLKYITEVQVPGYKPANLNVTISGGLIKIQGILTHMYTDSDGVEKVLGGESFYNSYPLHNWKPDIDEDTVVCEYASEPQSNTQYLKFSGYVKADPKAKAASVDKSLDIVTVQPWWLRSIEED